MKKVLALSFFAIAALVSQAGAACTSSKCCYWAADNCWGIGGEYDDIKTETECTTKSGLVVNSCSEGSTIYCDFGVCTGGSGYNCTDGGCYAKPGATTCETGATKVTQCECSHMSPSAQAADSRCGGTSPGGGGDPTPSTGDMCLWSAGGDCWPVPDATSGKTVADCEALAWHFRGGTQGEGTFCAGGTFVAGKTDTPPTSGGPSLGCCKWSTETQCYDVYTQTEVTDCGYGSNQFWAGACPDKQGTCPSGPPTTSIKFTPASQALIVAPYGRSLHISSVRDAMVSLYDMSGAKVYSGRVRAGNSVFSLQTVPAGSYYAIVQSGSNYKKVAVILK